MFHKRGRHKNGAYKVTQIPTIIVYKGQSRLIINESDKEKYAKEGWSEKGGEEVQSQQIEVPVEKSTRDELFKQAEALGLKPRKNATEASLIEAIEKAQNQNP